MTNQQNRFLESLGMKKKKQNKWEDPFFAFANLSRDNLKWWNTLRSMPKGKKKDPRKL